MILTKFNQNDFFRKVFKSIPDVVHVHADYQSNSIIYRQYMDPEYKSIEINNIL